jgi:hypothetical protein
MKRKRDRGDEYPKGSPLVNPKPAAAGMHMSEKKRGRSDEHPKRLPAG